MLAAFGLAGGSLDERAEICRASIRHCANTFDERNRARHFERTRGRRIAAAAHPHRRTSLFSSGGRWIRRTNRAAADAALMLGAEIEAEQTSRASRRILMLRKMIAHAAALSAPRGIPAKRPLCT